MHLSVRLAGVAALGAVVAPPAAAQHPPVAPTTWAITGARIEPVSGPAISSGTIVIRDGLITAVGANVTAPADARVIDGTGLTVYPGFIDASGTLGMPAQGGNGGGGGQGNQAQNRADAANSNYGAGMQAEIRASDLLDPAANSFTAAHAAGFTAALTSQGSGIFRGAAAVIALRDGEPRALVIREPVAQAIGFSRGRGGGFGGGYPGSLMGVFAQLRQELLDAQHYRDLKAAYARSPRGMERPGHDPTLEALQPVIAATEPVIMDANLDREIRRALGLAKEFGLSPMISGGHEAWMVADELKAANAPVLLEIDFPRRSAGNGGAGGGRGGAASRSDSTPESMRVLRDRVNQPKGPGRLAAAGVRFALAAGGNFPEFLANLRRAVEGGLDKDRAVRAVTIEPATIFGVADRLGTIEVGKIANLTVVSGDLFDSDGKISRVFVDGEPFEISQPTQTPSPRNP